MPVISTITSEPVKAGKSLSRREAERDKAAPLRAGIVGAGLMGRWHAQAIRNAGARVAAISDPNLDAARRLAARYGTARSYAKVEQMLEEVDLDVLHICTPLTTHQEIAGRGINAGLHLVIEKPITPTAVEAARLYDQAAARGVRICPVHQFIFQDSVLKAKKLLPRIGRLVHLGANTCSAGGAGSDPAQLDVIVTDVLPHPLSLMQVFLSGGLPEGGWKTARPDHGELRVTGEAAGTSLSIFISMNARPTTCSFQIVGTEGTLHLDLFHGYAFMERGRVSKTRKVLHPFDLSVRSFSAAAVNLCRRAFSGERAYPGLQRLVSSYYQAVKMENESPISREDALAVAYVRDHLVDETGTTLNV